MFAFQCTSHKYTILSTHFDGCFKRIKLFEILHWTKITNSDFAYCIASAAYSLPMLFKYSMWLQAEWQQPFLPDDEHQHWVGQQRWSAAPKKRDGLLPISNQQTVAKYLQL